MSAATTANGILSTYIHETLWWCIAVDTTHIVAVVLFLLLLLHHYLFLHFGFHRLSDFQAHVKHLFWCIDVVSQ